MLNRVSPALNVERFIYYGRWWYDHSSTRLPVETTPSGVRAYPDLALAQGVAVLIRPATRAEQEAMLGAFERVTHELAREGFVSGLGNFDPTSTAVTVAEVETAKRALLDAAREYVNGLDYFGHTTGLTLAALED